MKPIRSLVFSAFALVSLLSVFVPISGAQQSDTTPPQLVALTLIPTTVDVTQSPATLSVVMHVTDNLSGTASVRVNVQSPSTGQSSFANATLNQGTG
jgi:hypothetical protein